MFLSVADRQVVRAVCGADGSWQVEPTLTGLTVTTIAADPTDSRTLYAGTQTDGIYRSTDQGQTWQPWGLAGQAVKSIAASPHARDTLYAGVKPAALFKSVDGGRSWSELTGFRHIPNRWWWFSPAERCPGGDRVRRGRPLGRRRAHVVRPSARGHSRLSRPPVSFWRGAVGLRSRGNGRRRGCQPGRWPDMEPTARRFGQALRRGLRRRPAAAGSVVRRPCPKPGQGVWTVARSLPLSHIGRSRLAAHRLGITPDERVSPGVGDCSGRGRPPLCRHDTRPHLAFERLWRQLA